MVICVSTSGVPEITSRFEIPILFRNLSWYPRGAVAFQTSKGASTMEWVTPQHEEINLNCEVSSYANAEL